LFWQKKKEEEEEEEEEEEMCFNCPVTGHNHNNMECVIKYKAIYVKEF